MGKEEVFVSIIYLYGVYHMYHIGMYYEWQWEYY